MTDQETEGETGTGAGRLPPGDTGVDVGETGGTGANGMTDAETADTADAVGSGNEAPGG
jgi:hypothetical protein